MKRLSTIDNAFVALDNRRHPMHIGLLGIYQPSEDIEPGMLFKSILKTYRDRIITSQILRSKLRKTPFGLDSPYWVDDDNFDLEYHVRHTAIPKPGGFRELSEVTSRIWANPIDLSRPPWETYVIEGLDNIEGIPAGSFGVLFKIHHSACDGISANDVIFKLHSKTPAYGETYYDYFEPEEVPTNLELISRAYFNLLFSPLKLFKQYRSLKQSKNPIETRQQPQIEPTRFNKPVKSNRQFTSANFSLTDLKEIKKAVHNATINDVVTAIIAGGLRRYLKEKNELPTTAMTAGIPISTRQNDDKMGGNQVNFMYASLCTDIADPVERLQAIHDDIQDSKACRDMLRARKQSDLVNDLPSGLMAAGLRMISMESLMARSQPLFSTVTTNVPGPTEPLYFCGAKLLRTIGLGAPADNLGLFHTVTSYCGEVVITPISCREMLPDPHHYGRCLRQSFQQLLDATTEKKTVSNQQRINPNGKAVSGDGEHSYIDFSQQQNMETNKPASAV